MVFKCIRLPSALTASVQSAKIDLVGKLWPHSIPCLFLSFATMRPHNRRHRISFFCAAQNMAIVETWRFIAVLPKVRILGVPVFLNLILWVHARYALRCWHQNCIKGSCTNTLFLAPFAATVLSSSKPTTISILPRYVCSIPSP